MKLVEYSVEGFMQQLASDVPAPGGGSASALMGSVGAALAAMVASLTQGKEKYREFAALTVDTLSAGERLKKRFLTLIDQDTAAFNAVSAAYKLPKLTEAEKEARRQAIEAALKQATEVPFAMMEAANECLQVVAQAVGKTNASAASDLGVAACALRAAAYGAWLNVLINLGGVKDTAFAARYRETGQTLLAESDALAAAVVGQIISAL